ncbi:hypothetical protein LTR94_032222, partial [Friedmanniomyces endolithicus]
AETDQTLDLRAQTLEAEVSVTPLVRSHRRRRGSASDAVKTAGTQWCLAPTPVAEIASLGAIVRLRRAILDLSQQDLADRAGVGRRFISELEAGKAALEFGKVLIVCRALGVTLTAEVTNGG